VKFLGRWAALLFLWQVILPLGAQEGLPLPAPPPAEELPAAEEAPPKETPEEMDIRTSTLTELAIWCRELGLSEGGTKEELSARLRDYYKLPKAAGGASSGSRNRTITIEAARATEYFTLEVVGEDYARLTGNVVISLKDGDAVHRISADEILYNRTRNLMSASGNVVYEKKEGDTTETFRGDSITVNLDNWSSIFTNGQSERAVESAGTAYRFEGTIISSDAEESTVLTNAKITNAKTEEPYWSLNASKMWLLSGSDWAVANAVLKVGEIPVLYLPFFYLPSEEIVFHPVIGYRTREGSFFQTTTYLLGRAKATETSESSFTSMFGNNEGMEKERQGFFLRTTGKKSVSPNDTRLSLLFDAYANLGAYLGSELSLPRKGIFGGMELSAGIGLTRTIFPGNTPFDSSGNDEWNTKNRFLFFNEPFRYRLKTNGSLAGALGTFNWSFPLYSDPLVNQDFMNRSERLDWNKILKGSTVQTEETTDMVVNTYAWTLNTAFNPKLPVLAPYISTLSISNFSSTLDFTSQTSTLIQSPAPNHTFFTPNKWTVYSISTVIAGTPFSLGGPPVAQTKKTGSEDDFLQGIGTPVSPWGLPTTSVSASAPQELTPPVLAQRFSVPATANTRFAIDYRFTPISATELQFARTGWKEQEDIDWGDYASVLSSVRGDGSVNFTLSHSLGLYSTGLRFSETSAWQDYTYLDETDANYDTEAKRDAAHRRAYQQTQFSASYEYSALVKPFYLNPVWGNTSFQYVLRGLIFKNTFDPASTAADPRWKPAFGAWEKEKIDSQQVIANINASIMDKVQNLTLTADIPPRDSTLAGSMSIRAWISETSIRGKVYDPFGWQDSRKTDTLIQRERAFDPIYFTETLKYAAPAGTFFGGSAGATYQAQQYAVFDPELNEWTNLTSTLVLGGFSASYIMLRSPTYELDVAGSGGWVKTLDEEKLNPSALTFTYVKKITQDRLWKNRLSFSVNTSSNLSLDLQRYTYSQFTFSLNLTVKIVNFLDLTFSTTSANNVISRYIQNWPMFDTDIELPGEQNVFIDLFNSFRFDDDEKRKSSGFKLKSFKLSLTHHLGDWDASLGITLSPYLDLSSGTPLYKFNNQISFLVKWIPISELKTETVYDKDVITFK
jgi:hypothetical protein